GIGRPPHHNPFVHVSPRPTPGSARGRARRRGQWGGTGRRVAVPGLTPRAKSDRPLRGLRRLPEQTLTCQGPGGASSRIRGLRSCLPDPSGSRWCTKGPRRMRVLITGGAGFIGSHMAEAYLARGDEVLVLDDLSTGSIDNIRHLKSNPRFHYTIESVHHAPTVAELVDQCRSEERRVGKECRSRWAPDH